MADRHNEPLLGWHPASAEDAAWVRKEAQRRGRGALTKLLDEALSDLRSKHAPRPSPVVAAEDEQPEHAGTDRSWESAAEIARRVTRRTDEGGKQ